MPFACRLREAYNPLPFPSAQQLVRRLGLREPQNCGCPKVPQLLQVTLGRPPLGNQTQFFRLVSQLGLAGICYISIGSCKEGSAFAAHENVQVLSRSLDVAASPEGPPPQGASEMGWCCSPRVWESPKSTGPVFFSYHHCVVMG